MYLKDKCGEKRPVESKGRRLRKSSEVPPLGHASQKQARRCTGQETPLGGALACPVVGPPSSKGSDFSTNPWGCTWSDLGSRHLAPNDRDMNHGWNNGAGGAVQLFLINTGKAAVRVSFTVCVKHLYMPIFELGMKLTEPQGHISAIVGLKYLGKFTFSMPLRVQ